MRLVTAQIEKRDHHSREGRDEQDSFQSVEASLLALKGFQNVNGQCTNLNGPCPRSL